MRTKYAETDRGAGAVRNDEQRQGDAQGVRDGDRDGLEADVADARRLRGDVALDYTPARNEDEPEAESKQEAAAEVSGGPPAEP